jgi:uncharacterized protein YbcC (UPF0753/DUF2309 family)
MSPRGLASKVHHALEHVAHLLPAQGPIEVFVHHNTLHAFEDRPFFEAASEAEQTLGVHALWPLRQCLALRAAGRIDASAIEAGKRAWRGRGGVLPELDEPLAALGITGEAVLDVLLEAPLRTHASEAQLQFAIDEGGLLDRPGAHALFAECRRLPLARTLRVRSAHGAASPRTLLLRAGAEDSAELVNPVMVRLTAAYLDLGLARRFWPERERGFLAGFEALTRAATGPTPAWQADLEADVEDDARTGRSALEIVELALRELGASGGDVEALVREILLQLPGWAGMMSRLERVPADRPAGAPPASLAEFLAVRLRHDLCAWRFLATSRGLGPLAGLASRLERRRGDRSLRAGAHEGAYPLMRLASGLGLGPAQLASLDAAARERLLGAAAALEPAVHQILHEAYELHYADRFLGALVHPGRPAVAARSGRSSVDIVTCIDDREESFRRAVEETDPAARTFGTAGFFGLPIAFPGLDELGHAALCPVVQTPALDLIESPEDEHAEHGRRRADRRDRLGRLEAWVLRGTRSLGWGLVLTPIVGLLSALPFAAQVLFPRASSRAQRRMTNSILPAPRTRLSHGEEGRRLALPERAGRVQSTLEGMGLVRDFAEVVVILGHGSSSVNNPHRSAYDCGACGGRHGGPNARYFAVLANDAEVRAELRRRGLDIPDDTVFVGGAHDTATDGIHLFDLDAVPLARRPALERVQALLETARRRSAHERYRRFASAPRSLSPDGALRHVEARTEDLGQARPELGHVTNAACVVGRRGVTEGLFLDRRSFLVSYDPGIDPSGAILERTLAAVGPAGAGISLEYLFSTVDNTRLGCGTKLPHNVVGLLGVMEGSESDLRTGLPRQMIEIHEPMRLLLVCEARVDTIRAILERNSGIRALVEREWVRLVTIDPDTRELFAAERGVLVPYVPGRYPLARRASSVECYVERGRAIDGFLPVFAVNGASRQVAVSHA